MDGPPDPDAPGPDPGDLAVVEALEEYGERAMEVLEAAGGDPEGAVRGLVALHVAWTVTDPDRAREVAAGRNRAMAGPLGPRLREANRELFGRLSSWVDEAARSGRLGTDSVALLHAVVFAPTQELAKLHLAGLLDRPLEEYGGELADAAWAAIAPD